MLSVVVQIVERLLTAVDPQMSTCWSSAGGGTCNLDCGVLLALLPDLDLLSPLSIQATLMSPRLELTLPEVGLRPQAQSLPVCSCLELSLAACLFILFTLLQRLRPWMRGL